MTDWSHWIDRTETRHDVVTPGLVARLRATINSAGTGHGGAGDIAPLGVHWCLCLPDAMTADLGEDGHPNRSLPNAFLPPIPLPRRMWASSKVDFLTPIMVGSDVERISTITAITEKDGSSGRLVFVTIRHEMRANSELAVREDQMLVYRGAMASAPQAGIAPSPATPHDLSMWPHRRSITPNEPMLLRYSALTFNAHRIHYDLPYAQQVEGYAGLVVHGPLSATLLLDFAAQLFGPDRVKQFAFRGRAPAICGEAITLVARPIGNDVKLAVIGSGGTAVMEASASLIC
ncbi:MAG: MaoC family dehydratase N-terminal domain-containing protein [Sphingopyxis sp.]